MKKAIIITAFLIALGIFIVCLRQGLAQRKVFQADALLSVERLSSETTYCRIDARESNNAAAAVDYQDTLNRLESARNDAARMGLSWVSIRRAEQAGADKEVERQRRLDEILHRGKYASAP
jgi:hypothetical protein